MEPLFITTAIDYVNAKPHVGHALEKIQADVVARYWRANNRAVFFLTGTDENSLSNVRAAKKAGQPINDFVDTNVAHFRALGELLHLSFDDFIRTTEERHIRGAQKFWQALRPDDVYKKLYRGLYCVGCEEFKTEKDLVDGLCPEHKRAPEPVEEENYFFRLSRYQKELEELLASERLAIVPQFRTNEVLQFLKGGLEDLSISRSTERAEGWGVPVPGDLSQMMYVWVDALSNYLTALDYATDGERFQRFWAGPSHKLHMIGKGIIRFHAIYWPAFLLSAGLPLPNELFVHEYLTVDGHKMSKSIGNAIDPVELVEIFGTDGARYLLLVSLPVDHDGDMSLSKLRERYTADLVNGLGNLLQRTLVLRQKLGVSVSAGVAPRCAAADELTEQYRFADALAELWRLVDQANQHLEWEAPWQEADPAKQTATLTSVTRQLETIAASLAAYLPTTAARVRDQLHSGIPDPLFPRLR